MKTTARLLSVILLLVSAAFAADICDGSVFDGANVLGPKMSQVASAAQALDAQGADTRIITVKLGNFPTLDALVVSAVKRCPSWQSPNGGVKTNLVVLAVAPAEHKMGIYVGKGWDSAFSSAQTAKYKASYMGPYFKSADWAGGLIAGATQMTARLSAYKSEANAPVTNTTVNEAAPPTDFKGLWIFLLTMAGIGGVVLAFIILSAIKRKKEEKEEAQQNAIAAKAETARNINSVGTLLDSYNGKFDGNPGAKYADEIYGRVSSEFSELQNSVTFDPTDSSLSLGQYQSILFQYKELTSQLAKAKSCLSDPKQDPFWNKPADAPTTGGSSSSMEDIEEPVTATKTVHHHHHHDSAPSPVYVAPSSGNDLLTGVLIGEQLNRPSRSEEPIRYEEPAPSRPSFTDSSSSSSFSEPEPEKEERSSFTSSSNSSSFNDDSSSSSSFSDSSSSSSDFGSSSGSDFGSSSGSDSF